MAVGRRDDCTAMAQTSTTKHVLRGVVGIVLAVFVAVYCEMLLEVTAWNQEGAQSGLIAGVLSADVLVRMAVVFVLTAIVIALLLRFPQIFRWFDAYRYPIAGVVLIICVLLEISGSSIAVWASLLPGDNSTGTLFGTPRVVRSDEWEAFTPFAFSQSYTGYSAVSEIVRATPTDMTIVYAQPCWALATLFRPFLWGYLLLGSAKGLSFFWCGRLLVLSLVSYECAKVYTNENKYLSAVIAALFTFSPLMQWWFAVNGTAELLIFGQGIVLCVYTLAGCRDKKRFWLFGILLAWLMTDFVLIIYPAWQVPFFYLFAIFAIWAISKRKRRGDFAGRVVVVAIVVCFIVCFILVGVSLYVARDAVFATLNTAYPGNRVDLGGGAFSRLFDWGYSLFEPLYTTSIQPNQSERSAMFSLFPLGLLLAVVALSKKRDGLLVALLVLEVFFICYMVFGLPEPLAKITLMSRTTTGRLEFAIGCIDITLLARSVAIWRSVFSADSTHSASVPMAYLATAGAALLLTVVCSWVSSDMVSHTFALMLFLALFAVLAPLFNWIACGEVVDAQLLAISFAAIMLVSGLAVNPVEHGISSVEDNEAIQSIAEVASSDSDGVWAADAYYYGQACIMAGAPCITSLNAYPALDRWASLDPEGTDSYIYNRYSHIALYVTEEPTSFELVQGDLIYVHVNTHDLEKLGIDYYISSVDISEMSDDTVVFDEVSRVSDNFIIYKVNYQ